MCKFISSDIVIGNFVIEAIAKDDFCIEIEKLYSFDKRLSESLQEYNYYTRFDDMRLLDFSVNYPFFIKSIDQKYINILNEAENKEDFIKLLIRYFRLGMPKIVIDEIKLISQRILG